MKNQLCFIWYKIYSVCSEAAFYLTLDVSILDVEFQSIQALQAMGRHGNMIKAMTIGPWKNVQQCDNHHRCLSTSSFCSVIMSRMTLWNTWCKIWFWHLFYSIHDFCNEAHLRNETTLFSNLNSMLQQLTSTRMQQPVCLIYSPYIVIGVDAEVEEDMTLKDELSKKYRMSF
jgi:hypothetical protein